MFRPRIIPVLLLRNLGTGVSYSVENIVEIIKRNYKYAFEVFYSNDNRRAEVNNCFADITHCYNVLGWVPKVKLEDGIIDLLKFND
jgi:nucleoside-diphosphate-sugar epimerase